MYTEVYSWKSGVLIRDCKLRWWSMWTSKKRVLLSLEGGGSSWASGMLGHVQVNVQSALQIGDWWRSQPLHTKHIYYTNYAQNPRLCRKINFTFSQNPLILIRYSIRKLLIYERQMVKDHYHITQSILTSEHLVDICLWYFRWSRTLK